jgi:uncharacterized membrane protein YedE/YeeE
MASFTPFASLLGGMLIGLASIGVMLLTRRIAGISGIVGGMLSAPEGDFAWRLAFVLGLIGAGAALHELSPASLSSAGAPSPGLLALAGLLVGFGTRLGNGCTSGHGVCGISRLSSRSLVATGVFMFSAGLTVWAVRVLGLVA